MFVRFHQTATRLQCALVETRRVDGKVRQEHVAALGSVPTPPEVSDRLKFWTKLHDRLGKLSNRVGGEDRAKIMGAIHARIPMVMITEQAGLQLENLTADHRFWTSLRESWKDEIEGKKALVTKLQREIAEAETRATSATEHATEIQSRIERLQRGESVGGGFRRMTRADFTAIVKSAGWTDTDIRYARLLASLNPAEFEAYLEATIKDHIPRERAILRAHLRRRNGGA